MKSAVFCLLLCAVMSLPAFPYSNSAERVVLFRAVQEAKDCSSGCTGPTDEEYSISQQGCTAHPNTSCGSGCTCRYGFLLSVTNGVAVARWFHVSFATGKAVFGEPGPLARHRVAKGDSVYRLNGKIPTRELFDKYTRKSPARLAEARWDSQGRLHLRLWR